MLPPWSWRRCTAVANPSKSPLHTMLFLSRYVVSFHRVAETVGRRGVSQRKRNGKRCFEGGRTLGASNGERFQLVALDIDHTLLEADQQVAPANLDAVRRCIDRGVEVVLATGRTKPTTIPVSEQIGSD